jgi:hypothetical protein
LTGGLAIRYDSAMPFPLAHPAAVLPLRRFCPRYLDFPALVIGSLSPDVGYAFGNLNAAYYPTSIANFAHQPLAGTFGFCLPVGLVLVLGFYLLRLPVVRLLPACHRRVFLPLCKRPVGPPLLIFVSLLLGAWSHQLLDAFADSDNWLGRYLPVLPLGQTSLRVDEMLYILCTFCGVAWLALVYLRWWEQAAGAVMGRQVKWGAVVMLAGATLFLALASRGSNHLIGLMLVGMISGLLVIGFLLATGWIFSRPRKRK